MIRSQLGTLRQLQGTPGALAAMEDDGEDRIGILSLHLPSRATLEETEVLLVTWGKLKALTQKKVVVGFDCNESFDFDDDTARGETILTWILGHGAASTCSARQRSVFLSLQHGSTTAQTRLHADRGNSHR